jgi:outer membrane murein-binding lipoprotein Lpp
MVGNEINIIVESFDKNNNSSILIDKKEQLNTSITSVSVNFTTPNDVEKIRIYFCTEDRAQSSFYITELSLYNASVYYPWEPCPEDTDKQIGTKLDNNRLSVFNTLTNNNAYRAIYESENQYYIRSEYIVPAVVSQTDFDSAYNNLSNRVTQLETKVAQLETKYNQLETKYNQLETKYNQLETKHNQLETKHTNEVNAINTELTNIKARLLALETPGLPTPPSWPTE